MPSQRVASGAKRTVWSPTQTALSQRRRAPLLEKKIASVFDVSRRAALPSAPHLLSRIQEGWRRFFPINIRISMRRDWVVRTYMAVRRREGTSHDGQRSLRVYGRLPSC